MTISSKRIQYDDGMIAYKKIGTRPMEAIVLFCHECMGDLDRIKPLKKLDRGLVSGCTDSECPLFPFREGKDPFRKKRTPTKRQLESLKSSSGSSIISKD